jgi:hypothetical protein
MVTAAGRVSELLYGADDEVNGLLLDCGEEVHFPEGQGHLVRLILEVGSHVEIEGIPAFNDAYRSCIAAALITNCDSKRSMTFLTPTNQGKPGMLADPTPDAQVSLVLSDGDGHRVLEANEAEKNELSEMNQPHRAKQQNGSEAAAAIGLAYDSLHRIQAVLAAISKIGAMSPQSSRVGIDFSISVALGRFRTEVSLRIFPSRKISTRLAN